MWHPYVSEFAFVVLVWVSCLACKYNATDFGGNELDNEKSSLHVLNCADSHSIL